MDSVVLDVLERVALPAISVLAGWYGKVWKDKRQKNKDILDNVQQILVLQKQYITEQDQERQKDRDLIKRLEEKLDNKNQSIRKANKCKYTAEGEGCPVLAHEEYLDDKCKKCKHFEEDAKG